MKILSYLLPSLLPLLLVTSTTAQKADAQGPEQGAKSSCCESGAVASKTAVASKSAVALKASKAKKGSTSQIAVFQKLDTADKKAVAAAFARLNETCPYGSRLGKTIVTLDKLYADATQNLTKVAQHENCDPALVKDLMAEVKVIGDLRAINAVSLKTAQVILAVNTKAAAAGGCCGAEEAKTAKAGTGCCDEGASETKATAKSEAGCCGGCDSQPGASVVYADTKKLTDSWANAKKDFTTLDTKARAQLQADMKLLSSKGLQLPQLVMASVTAQSKKIGKAHAGLSCSTTGLVKKHEKLITEGSFTSLACVASDKALASASALLKASTTALNPSKGGASKKAEAGCCDSAKASKIGQ